MKIFKSVLLFALAFFLCASTTVYAGNNDNGDSYKHEQVVGTYRLADWTIYQDGVETHVYDPANFYPNGDQGWLYVTEDQILVYTDPYMDPFFAHAYIQNYTEVRRDGDRWLVITEPNLPGTPFRFDARFSIEKGKQNKDTLITHFDYTYLFGSTVSVRNTLKWVRVSDTATLPTAPLDLDVGGYDLTSWTRTSSLGVYEYTNSGGLDVFGNDTLRLDLATPQAEMSYIAGKLWNYRTLFEGVYKSIWLLTPVTLADEYNVRYTYDGITLVMTFDYDFGDPVGLVTHTLTFTRL